MTVSTTAVQKAYTGNNSTTTFPTTFEFWDSSELRVYLRVIATGVETLQAETTEYTVSGGDGATGTVEMVTAPTTAQELHIRRVTATTQTKDITSSTKVPLEAMEEAIDRAAMRDQEDRLDVAQRALLIPVTDIPVSGSAPDMELPSTVDRAVSGALLGFDLSGNPIVVTGTTPSEVSVTAFMETLLDDTTAAAGRATLAAVGSYDGNVDLISAGASVPGLVGDLLAIDTSKRQIFYVNSGLTVFPLGIEQLNAASLPAPGTSGRLLLDTNNTVLYRDNITELSPVLAPYTRGHISGLSMTLSGADMDVTIAVGEARAGTAADRSIMNATLTTAITKQLDTAGGWAEGTNAAGRPSADALAANKWHHVFLLVKPDGTVDAGFDDDPDAVNLLADSAVSAAGYTRFRYVGSVRETAAGTGACVPFVQYGDHFLWTTIPGIDVATSTADYTAADNAVALDYVPPDFNVRADVVAYVSGLGTSNYAILVGGDQTIGAVPTAASSPLASIGGAGTATENRGQFKLWTDTSGQIVWRPDDTTTALNIEVHGYTNPRGKNQ